MKRIVDPLLPHAVVCGSGVEDAQEDVQSTAVGAMDHNPNVAGQAGGSEIGKGNKG